MPKPSTFDEAQALANRPTTAIAHSRNAQGARHDLVQHLTEVAESAGEFGAKFGAGELARVAGLWHDLGKFHPDFQEYLYRCEIEETHEHGPDHKAAGSSLAQALPEDLGLFLAMVIAGHHGGLQDKIGGFDQWLLEKQAERGVESNRFQEALRIAYGYLPDLDRAARVALPEYKALSAGWTPDSAKRQLEFLTRMVFSCLVDADFLDTERHFNASRAELRQEKPDLNSLWQHFLDAQARTTTSIKAAPNVLRVRREVFEACVARASEEPGFFRLTVPTGGGKTHSGLAFALNHARLSGLDRVIFALPYTSICEQTTDSYRALFPGGRTVLEHHSAARVIDYDAPATATDVWARLAAENWDAPIIVTTTVQLLESLLGNQTSRCRKLHNLARSVIVLDEAQTLPTHMLDSVVDTLKELVRTYRTTVVFCTATQPDLESALGSLSVSNVREIVSAQMRARHFAELKRVTYEWPAEPWSWKRAAEEMSTSRQALAIVNTRKAAHQLGESLTALGIGPLHLSTQLCGAHRLVVLREVKRRLAAGEPCCLVSTQVVEAGVDIDFPLVLRALGPLDRIVQAAGRCNRAGLLAAGRVIVFQPEDGAPPPGDYSKATSVTKLMRKEGPLDPDDPETFPLFFKRYYGYVDRDRRHIQGLRESWSFQKVAHAARVIEDETSPVVVPCGGYKSAVIDLQSDTVSPRLAWRRAQPFIVNLRSYEIERARAAGLLQPIREGIDLWLGIYDETFGLDLSSIPHVEAARLATREDWA